jgi:hypothetical protein
VWRQQDNDIIPDAARLRRRHSVGYTGCINSTVGNTMHQPYRIVYRPEPDVRLPRWMQRLWYWFC